MTRLRIAVVSLASAAFALAGHAMAEGRALPVAADAGHAWFVVERATAGGAEQVLLHHADAMGCDCVREALVLPAAPEAMVAVGNDLWMVMPAPRDGRRDVLRTSTLRNPATGAWYSAGPPAVFPSLPAEGVLRGIAPTEDGLLALRAGASMEQLATGRWTPVPGEVQVAGCSLTALRGRPALVDTAGAVRVQTPGGAWEPLEVAPAGPEALGLVPGAPRPTAVVRLPGGGRAVRVLVRGSALEAGRYEPPDRASGVVAVGDRLALVQPLGDGGAAFRWLDPMTGALGEPAVLAPQPADATRWVCLPSLAMLLLAVGTFVAVRRWTRLKSGSGERR